MDKIFDFLIKYLLPGLPGASLVIGVFYLYIKNKLKKQDEDLEKRKVQLISELDASLNGRLENIFSIVNNDMNKRKIISESEIGVISNSDILLGKLVDLGFKKARSVRVDDANDVKKNLLVFDGNEISHEKINQIVKKRNDFAFVVSIRGRIESFDARICFANSEITLFNRVLEALFFISVKESRK